MASGLAGIRQASTDILRIVLSHTNRPPQIQQSFLLIFLLILILVLVLVLIVLIVLILLLVWTPTSRYLQETINNNNN